MWSCTESNIRGRDRIEGQGMHVLKPYPAGLARPHVVASVVRSLVLLAGVKRDRIVRGVLVRSRVSTAMA